MFEAFEPVFDANSELLILGSFPSVKSRENEFYYGNPQNRFWKTLSEFFGESEPKGNDDKRAFLSRNKIALWDTVKKAEIKGSLDSNLVVVEIADIESILKASNIREIFCNGKLSFALVKKHFPNLEVPFVYLPSTSPANARFDKDVWMRKLGEIFGKR